VYLVPHGNYKEFKLDLLEQELLQQFQEKNEQKEINQKEDKQIEKRGKRGYKKRPEGKK